MLNLRQRRGQSGEEAAVRHLRGLGYRVIARNWRPAIDMRGEIDGIAWHGSTLCFVEVKCRASNDFGAPQEAVNLVKQRQLSRLANAYISLHRLHDTSCRFDVVEVWIADEKSKPVIRLHQNAFEYLPGKNHAGRR